MMTVHCLYFIQVIMHFFQPMLGLLCNPQCPDELRLDELTSNNWHFGIKIFIASVVGILAITCVLIKLLFSFWLLRLEKKQSGYLKSLDKDGKKSTSVVHKV